MKTLLQNQKSKLLFSTIGISMLSTSLCAEQKTLTYADIKSKITQQERVKLLQKRDHLAQNTANRDLLYVSTVLDRIREGERAQRIK